MIRDTYDIIVIGGGTSGVVAATQAARCGASTLLIEKTGMLGGTVTNAGVAAVSSFHAHGRQIIAGIGWEWVERTARAMGKATDDILLDRKSHTLARVNGPVFAAMADNLVLEAGADLLLHAMPVAASRDDGQWTISIATKRGLRDIKAHALIDCTGDANIVSLAGLPVRRPDTLQPGTLVMRLDGYDPESLDLDAIQAACDRAIEQGMIKMTDTGWHQGKLGHLLSGRGANCMHVPGVDGATSEGRTHAEVEARKAMMRITGFLRTQPGLEKLRIAWTAAECGIRETLVIDGRAEVTADDYVAGRVYDDAVCYSYYPIDIHCENHIDYRTIPDGIIPTLPLGALLPKRGRRIAVAGRCACGDREANSSFRVQAPCMAMGQAAAVAASLAIKQDCDIHEVPIDNIRDMLRQHKAIVPPDLN